MLRRVSLRPVAPMNGVHTLEFANPRGVFDPEYAIRVDATVAKANASSFGGPNMGTVQPLNRMTAIGSSTETGPTTRVVEPSPWLSVLYQSARITCRSVVRRQPRKESAHLGTTSGHHATPQRELVHRPRTFISLFALRPFPPPTPPLPLSRAIRRYPA